MSEFTDVMRQARRMCKAHEGCKGCPMWDTAEYFCRIDITTCYSDDDETESIVMKWAAEHPEPGYPTWREWQESTFPDAHKHIMPCEFGNKNKFNCTGKICLDCIEQRIPADIAEKLGIRPKEAK